MAGAFWHLPPADAPRFPRHQLRFEIGAGGMSSVFLAEPSAAPGTWVAIKTLRSLEDRRPAERRQILDEARVLSRFEHPNIVRLLEVGEDASLPYLVMEYVHGEALSTVLAETPRLPPALALFIGARIADALAEAHALAGADGRPLGLVHRDLAPENLLLGYDGIPRLVDFGIAWSRERSEQTATGIIKGRLRYMSPEQRSGLGLDARSDLYSLGLVIAEAVGGLHGRVLEPLRAGEEPWRVPEAPELERVLAKALAPAREQRFARAEDLRDAFLGAAGSFGPALGPPALADYLTAHLGERRRMKEQLLSAPDLRSAETQPHVLESVPPPAPPPPTPIARAPLPQRAPSRRGWLWALLAVIAAGLGATLAISSIPERVVLSPQDVVCLLGSAGPKPESREATWLLVRMIAGHLEQIAPARWVHGYRAMDLEGWDREGADRAGRACAAAGSTAVVRVLAESGARWRVEVSVEVGGRSDRRAIESDRAAELALRVAVDLVQHRGPSVLAPPTRSPEALEALIHAREHLWQGRYAEALPAATRALEADPQLEEAYLIRALVSWWSGHLDQPEARGAVLARPEGMSPRLAHTFELLDLLVAGEVGRTCERARAIRADRREVGDAYVAYALGEALFHSCDPRGGAELLSQALAMRPELGPARYHVKRELLARGDWSSALALAREWRRIDPTGPGAALLEAAVLLGQGRYPEAVTAYEAVLAHASSARVEAELGIAHARALMGDAKNARERLERTVALGGSSDAMREMFLVGYALAVLEGDERAIARWQGIVRDHVGSTPIREVPSLQLMLGAGVVDALLGRWVEAEKWRRDQPEVELPRAYRYRPLMNLLDALDARHAGSLPSLRAIQGAELDRSIAPLVEAMVAERSGQSEIQEARLTEAVDSKSDGELDCVALAEQARARAARGDAAGLARSCERLRRPRLPTAFCYAARGACPDQVSSP